MTEKLKGKIRVYACGGAGINIAKSLENFRGVDEVGFAHLDSVYVDTSRSNLNDAIEPHCYLLDGLDGSGKIRKENYQQISAHTRDILQKYAPLDLNIVISSGSGGSGSVIGPSIVSELLDRDLPTVVILIGATDTRLEIDNTLKTIKSYDAISKLRDKPVVVAYHENSKETPRSTVDAVIVRLITGFMTVYSRENRELDSRDLFNFLRFERVTTFPTQLASVALHVSEFPADISEAVISVATLCVDGQDSGFDFTPDYQCVGFLPEGAPKASRDITPINLVVTANLFASVVKKLNGRLDELTQQQRARVSAGPIVSDKDQATDSGLVL